MENNLDQLFINLPADFELQDDQIIDKKRKQRSIFQNVKYTEHEQKHLNLLKQYIKSNKMDTLLDFEFDGQKYWQDWQLLKFLYSRQFDAKKTVQMMNEHVEYLNDKQYTQFQQKSYQMLKEGMFYHLGLDKQYHPVIILRLNKIYQFYKTQKEQDILYATYNFLFLITQKLFIPGKIEQWVVIMDSTDLSLFSLPMNMMKKLVKLLTTNFNSNLNCLFLYNPPKIIMMAWTILQKILDKETTDKVKLVEKNKFDQILQKIDEQQLEKRFGGIVENQAEYWPPNNIHSLTNRPKQSIDL